MIKIMFVCHGNICRSPMAEFIFKDMVKKAGLSEQFSISSSATSNEEIWGSVGNPVYPPTKEELLKHGLSCDGKRAVQLKRDDYDNYDLFVGMDSANYRNMLRIFGSDKDKKIRRMSDYTPHGQDVSDPWYSGDFETAYKDIFGGCQALLDELKSDMAL